MMQFPGRFLILTCLSIAAVFVLQSSLAFASEKPVLLATWGCPWEVKVAGNAVGSGEVKGITLKKNAKPAALVAATAWADAHLGTSIYEIAIGDAFLESDVLPPGEESKSAMSERMTSSGQWTVLYQCTSRNGKTLKTISSGSTFCEAYSESRSFVCENISNKPFDGACRCCYQVLQRPCCGCCSGCR